MLLPRFLVGGAVLLAASAARTKPFPGIRRPAPGAALPVLGTAPR